MTGPDLLESGPERRPVRPGRRRLAGIVAVLALAAGAGTLAVRSTQPDRAVAPTPTPRVRTAVGTPDYYLYDVATTSGRVYALAGVCADTPCGYRLLVRAGEKWTSTPLDVPAGSSFPGRLLLTGTGDRYVVVLDGANPGTYVSGDAGRTFAAARVRPGPPLASVPAGLVPEVRAGESGGGLGIGVFDPATGQWRALAGQPVREVRDIAADGGALRVVTREGRAIVVATSTDAGRSWTRATVTEVGYETPVLRLVGSGDGGTYLVVTRPLPGGDIGVAAVWRGGPAWSRVVDYTRQAGGTPRLVDAIGRPAGILLTDGRTGGVRVYADGRTAAYERPAGDEASIPGVLSPGPDGAVLAIAMDGWHLLRHGPDGDAWQPVPLPT